MTTFNSIFATPVLETNIGVSKDILKHIHNLKYRRTDYENADISLSMSVLDKNIFSEYSKKIDHYVKKFCFDFVKFDKKKVKLERTASWSNRYHSKDWCQYHNHANSFITGVWYLETPKNSGDLELHNPRFSFGEPISFECFEYNSVNSHSYTFECKAGNLIIFPSIIGHSVGKNMSKKIRSCIAFNYYARGEVSSEEKIFYT